MGSAGFWPSTVWVLPQDFESCLTSVWNLCSENDLGYVFVYSERPIWEFPKIRVPFLGVLTIRILLFRVLY